MSTLTAIVIGIAIGAIAMLVGFVMANRNKPEALDAAEQKVRDFKKP